MRKKFEAVIKTERWKGYKGETNEGNVVAGGGGSQV